MGTPTYNFYWSKGNSNHRKAIYPRKAREKCGHMQHKTAFEPENTVFKRSKFTLPLITTRRLRYVTTKSLFLPLIGSVPDGYLLMAVQ
jgi:hypothetical protein